ncbi:MAG: hypothetical protein ABI876_05290, partial [Bacteroidota bacterium]
ASGTHDRLLLMLMRASLNVNPFPLTALGEHPPAPAQPEAAGEGRENLFPFLERILSLRMRDAATYAILLRGSGERNDLAEYVAMTGNQDDQSFQSYLRAGIIPSAAYINERRTEAGRFLKFLRGHTILPSSH